MSLWGPQTNRGLEEPQASFESPSQNARVWTEGWVEREAFCPNCGAESLSRFPNNRPVADFFCQACGEQFELKGQKRRFGRKVLDGAYKTMRTRLASDSNPNLFLMNYDLGNFSVINLFIIPRQFFVPQIIERRKPLAPTARRAGWVGCNILISHVPDIGKVHFIRDGVVLPKHDILEDWRRTAFLRRKSATARGWLVEVLNCVERIGRPDFSLAEVYAYENHLSALYPGYRHVRPKIRQQLQVLRDQGILEFLGNGRYRVAAR